MSPARSAARPAAPSSVPTVLHAFRRTARDTAAGAAVLLVAVASATQAQRPSPRAANATSPTNGSTTASASNAPAFVVTARNVSRSGAPGPIANGQVDLRPGETIEFRLALRNTTRGPLRGVVLANPIPAGLVYEAGSARTARLDAGAEFSVDGGRHYAAQPLDTVGAGPTRVIRPAATARYTHVRWVLTQPLAVGDSATATYRGTLGAPPTAAAAPAPASIPTTPATPTTPAGARPGRPTAPVPSGIGGRPPR